MAIYSGWKLALADMFTIDIPWIPIMYVTLLYEKLCSFEIISIILFLRVLLQRNCKSSQESSQNSSVIVSI